MKLVIPVKTNKENPAVSPLFGKAKWFAFVDKDGNIEIKKNEENGGGDVIRWFVSENVEAIVFDQMGSTPYNMIKEVGNITLFHSGYERILLNDVIQKFKNDNLTIIDDTNIEDIIKNHEATHTHSH